MKLQRKWDCWTGYLSDGWKSLSAKETGRIGGLMNERKKRETEKINE